MHRLERYFLGNFVCKGENYQLILQAKFGSTIRDDWELIRRFNPQGKACRLLQHERELQGKSSGF